MHNHAADRCTHLSPIENKRRPRGGSAGRPSEREQAIMDDAAATTAATGRAILDGAVAGGPGAPLGASGDAKRSAGRHAMAGRAGNRGTSPAEDHAADPPGSGAPPRLPFPPAVLRMMARYWNSRLAELDGAIAAETRPDRRAAFAFERLCVQGILAGLDERPGAS